MASTKPVNILEICHVSPSSTSPESSTELSLPLIFSDIFNDLQFPPVQGIFFYKLTELTPTFFKSVVLPKVKHSLSLTLSHFRPLAGNLTWPPSSTKPMPTTTICCWHTEMIKDLDNRSVLEGAKERLPYNFDSEPNTRQVRAAGTNRFGMYGADFGWGKPNKVEVTTIDRFGSFSIMESKDESGGVEVGVVLKEHEMKIFGSLFTRVKISQFRC